MPLPRASLFAIFLLCGTFNKSSVAPHSRPKVFLHPSSSRLPPKLRARAVGLLAALLALLLGPLGHWGRALRLKIRVPSGSCSGQPPEPPPFSQREEWQRIPNPTLRT